MMLSETSHRLLLNSTNQVTGLMDHPDSVAAAVTDLVSAGFPSARISVLSGDVGAQRVDPAGRHHGLRGRLVRFAQHAGEERQIWHQYAAHLGSGGFAVVVPARHHAQAATAADLLRQHGGHDLVHFGTGHWERLGSEPSVGVDSP